MSKKQPIARCGAVIALVVGASVLAACDPDTDQAPPADQPQSLTTKSLPSDTLPSPAGLVHHGSIAIDTTWAGEEHYTY